MDRSIIRTDRAPAAKGHYSQGVLAGGFLYTAGQLPFDPVTGTIADGDIEAQADQVLRNIRGIVEAAGGTLSDVVKVTVYIANMAHWSRFNDVYARFFTDDPPARSVVSVKELHYGALVEVDAVARIAGRA